ncbi:hypothetical protein AN286_01525 [Aliarcobacter cryaerophilus ATCC 43158]|uniref:Uncharacterized protein n=1 Tax=Aliarcobacter cryaerophilus ATCC 43158 TaxID=1032070 RepID=A0AAD0TUN2_9BACT|nr:hypothetical protein [Aliarcobacter cryaerophilus]AYJ80819.1 hypothetical protein ACRYA_1721 [Aliarcobacter cryaerophilus ATCC 43158]PRM98316.1 hypothetical protein CJ667_02460 [Aliarcobacter cryaerophilus]QCZ23147.1 hypothetical protein AN286_01525 [Aliarcobacter cryaerophilus ATCC 43158]
MITIFFITFILFFLFLYSNTFYKNNINYDILAITKLSNLSYSNYNYRFKDYENSFNNMIYLNPKISNFGFIYED